MGKKRMDYPIFFITMTLVAIGIVMVFSASFYYAQQKFNDSYYFFKRQGLWAIIGLCGMLVMANFDYWKLRKLSKVFLAFSLILLIAVLVVGVERNYAKRWLNIGGVSLQPSEIAKLAIIVYMADNLSKKGSKVKKFWKGIVPNLIVVGIFFGLILLQPNLSTAGSLVILSLVMLFVAGCNLWQLGGLLGVGAVGAVALTMLRGYRANRYTAFKDPWSDPKGKGYQIIQSLYSLGSGGLFGMGLGESRQKYLYLPYSETDFIFAIIGEELGFIGATIVILLFLILIWRGIKVAITAPDLFGSLLATGIISIIAIQVAINIAVVTNSMPATGVPLPFISYGGSSLFLFMSSIGVLLNISKYTTNT